MDIYAAITKRRTIRRFLQKPIAKDALVRMLEGARLAPSGGNMQPIRYIAVTRPELVARIFPFTRWATYLGQAGTPPEGLRPTCFVLVLGDKTIKKEGFDSDASAGIENILLAAMAEGLGSCWIGAIDRPKICELMGLADTLELHSLVALGYPAQSSGAVDMDGDTFKYWLDENGDIVVPKRRFDDIIEFIE